VTDASERIQRIADELAIRDLVAAYADAVTRKDAKAWSGTWADDATWILGGHATEGREAILARWNEIMSLFEFIAQLPQYGRIEIDGDRATGRWYVNELGRTKGGGPSPTLGVYHDVYARLASGWRFQRRRFDLLYVGAPDLSGQAFPFPADAE
jgi:uncharacterized protein (TIGR02246 family)